MEPTENVQDKIDSCVPTTTTCGKLYAYIEDYTTFAEKAEEDNESWAESYLYTWMCVVNGWPLAEDPLDQHQSTQYFMSQSEQNDAYQSEPNTSSQHQMS
tara:strand:- start:199 stop:498 length:300 start_codon:yes stop_codon:yes gene_type:complete